VRRAVWYKFILLIALMMEAASTFEMLAHFYQTTCRNNPEDSHLQQLSSLAHFNRWVFREDTGK
jgi:hypothetical protein